jgi:glutamine synthetase
MAVKTVADVLKMMKDKDVKFLDLRFTDTKGSLMAMHSTVRRLLAGRASKPPT